MAFEARRLSDKLRVAFNAACSQGDHETALALLKIMEKVVLQTPVVRGHDRRQIIESLVAAHERVWRLRQVVSAVAKSSDSD